LQKLGRYSASRQELVSAVAHKWLFEFNAVVLLAEPADHSKCELPGAKIEHQNAFPPALAEAFDELRLKWTDSGSIRRILIAIHRRG
jgi:hypothetical protein